MLKRVEKIMSQWAPVLPVLIALHLSGCGAIISNVTSNFANDLSRAIMNNDDPATVGDAIPAYLIIVDALVEGSPKNQDLLFAAADLNAAYASAFVENVDRRKALASKAMAFANRASCLKLKWTCSVRTMSEEDFTEHVARVSEKQIATLYGLASNWIAWIQVHADDWNAIADLGRAKALMKKISELNASYRDGQVAMYLGVFELLLPPAYGGRPEVGKKHFEESLAISKGTNLYAKVLYAEYYGRMVFDKELHDSLLREVLEANPRAEGLTLQNRLAQIRAQDLLEGSDEYF